jgi:subfamily B ATP-binding cassette protein MsbA
MKPVPARLWTYVRPYGWALSASLLLVAIVGVLEAASPFLIGVIFDTLLRGSAAPSIAIPLVDARINLTAVDGRIFLLLLVVTTLIKTAAEYGSIAAVGYLGHSVVRDLRNDAFEKILFQPLRFFHFNPTGELISRVSTDIERIQTAVSETVAEFLKQTAILIFLIVLIFAIDWRLAAMSVVLVPLVFYPTLWFGKKLRVLSKRNQEEMAQMANVLYETVTGNRIVKAFTMEKTEAGKFRKITQRIFRLNFLQKLTHSRRL